LKLKPAQLTVFDVFLLDSDFRIERPKRYYRQGFNLLQGDMIREEVAERKHLLAPPDDGGDGRSMFGSIKQAFSRMSRKSIGERSDAHPGWRSSDDRTSHASGDDSSDESSLHRPTTPLLDPSTGTNPLETGVEPPRGGVDAYARKGKKPSGEMSKHTFYIVNTQMRLKLFARSEVRARVWLVSCAWCADKYVGVTASNAAVDRRLAEGRRIVALYREQPL
jgi:phospholipase D1/2